MGVHHAFQRVAVRQTLLQKKLTAQRANRGAHHCDQQTEFCGCNVNTGYPAFTVSHSDCHRSRIDLHPLPAQHLFLRISAATGTTQHGLHTRDDFTRMIRLNHVIICPIAQRTDTIGRIPDSRHHNDGNVATTSDFRQHFSAVQAGQHDVQNYQVWLPALSLLQP